MLFVFFLPNLEGAIMYGIVFNILVLFSLIAELAAILMPVEMVFRFRFSLKLFLECILVSMNPFDDAFQSEFARTLQDSEYSSFLYILVSNVLAGDTIPTIGICPMDYFSKVQGADHLGRDRRPDGSLS